MRSRGPAPEGGGDGGAVGLPCHTQYKTRNLFKNVTGKVHGSGTNLPTSSIEPMGHGSDSVTHAELRTARTEAAVAAAVDAEEEAEVEAEDVEAEAEAEAEGAGDAGWGGGASKSAGPKLYRPRRNSGVMYSVCNSELR